MKENEELIEKKYEFFDHTADAKFRAYGASLREAFSNGAIALFSLITNPHVVKNNIIKTVEISANNKESLLYDFFDELIYLIDTEAFLLSKVIDLTIMKEKELYKLDARLAGDSAEEYETHSQLKSMTYHDLIIKEEPGFAMIQVVPDI